MIGPLQLLLIRHGEMVADIEQRHEGWADFPPTPSGRNQAERLADWIAVHHPPDVLIASPLQRAAETAGIIATCLNLPVTIDDRLKEIGNGVYAGLTYDEAELRYPWPQHGFKPHEAPEGGESQIAFRCRLEAFWSDLCSTTVGCTQRVAIVAHGGVIQMLYQSILRLPTVADMWVRTGHTGTHLLEISGETCTVHLANRLDHLLSPDDPRAARARNVLKA